MIVKLNLQRMNVDKMIAYYVDGIILSYHRRSTQLEVWQWNGADDSSRVPYECSLFIQHQCNAFPSRCLLIV